MSDEEVASEDPSDESGTSAPKETHLNLCERLLGLHRGPPPALPPEIQLLLWYHQLNHLGVLEDDEYTWKKRQLLATPPAPLSLPATAGQPGTPDEPATAEGT